MKTILLVTLVMLFLIALVPAAFPAPFIGCDYVALDTGTTSEVEVTLAGGTATVYAGTVQVMGTSPNQYIRLLDLGNFTSGKYTFRARFLDASGWPGDWSAPLSNAGKPAVPGNVKIKP